MDYKKIMDEKEINFSMIYEKVITNLCIEKNFSEELIHELSEKRKFGLEKYGEYSFQSSFINCIKTPTLQHATEEIIDLINYLLHERYKQTLLGRRDILPELDIMLNASETLYTSIKNLIDKDK